MIEQTIRDICSALQKHKFQVKDETSELCPNDRTLYRDPMDHKGCTFQAEITLVQVQDKVEISGGIEVVGDDYYCSLFSCVDFADMEQLETLVKKFDVDKDSIYMMCKCT